jgi:hypothetical protein
MFGPEALTHFVYVAVTVIFLAVVAYTIYYSRHQRAELKKAEQSGKHPHSVEEGILMALQQDELDRKLAHKHSHG